MTESRSRLAGRATLLTFVAFNLAAIAISLVLILLAQSSMFGTETELVMAIAAGVLGTAAFTLVQHLVTRRASNQVVVEAVHAALGEQFRDFLPDRDFPASDSPDVRFNEELQRDFRTSEIFYYRGVHPIQSAVRFAVAQPVNLSAMFVLPDPRVIAQAMTLRLSSRSRSPRYRHATSEKLLEKAVDDIRVGLAGLFLERKHCRQIEIYLVGLLPPDRLEFFRDGVWIASQSGMYVTRYPRTVRFGADSHTYRLMRNELDAGSRTALRSFRMDSSTTESQFQEMFAEIAGTDYLPTLETEYLKRKKAFAPYLRARR